MVLQREPGLAETSYDIAILDIEMPRLDGLSLTH